MLLPAERCAVRMCRLPQTGNPFRKLHSDAAVPLLVLVGAPNTGKTTLYNRLVAADLSHSPRALVSSCAGTTRDRLDGQGEWGGLRFRVCDSGGVAEAAGDVVGALSLEGCIEAQTRRTFREASALLMLVDILVGVTSHDEAIARTLRAVHSATGVPVLLGVNKADSDRFARESNVFWRLGLGEPRAFSAQRGLGAVDVLDELVELMRSRASALPPRHQRRQRRRTLWMLEHVLSS